MLTDDQLRRCGVNDKQPPEIPWRRFGNLPEAAQKLILEAMNITWLNPNTRVRLVGDRLEYQWLIASDKEAQAYEVALKQAGLSP